MSISNEFNKMSDDLRRKEKKVTTNQDEKLLSDIEFFKQMDEHLKKKIQRLERKCKIASIIND